MEGVRQRFTRRTAVRAFIGVAILGLLIWSVDISQLAQVFSKVDLRFVLLAAAAHVLVIFTASMRWKTLLRSLNIEFSAKNCFKTFFAGCVISDVTPSKLGDLLRLHTVWKQTDANLGSSTSSILAERVVDIGWIVFISTLGIFFILQQIAFSGLQMFVILSLCAIGGMLILMVLLLIHPEYFTGVLKRFATKLPLIKEGLSASIVEGEDLGVKIDGFTAELSDSSRNIFSNRKLFSVIIFLTVIKQAILCGRFYFSAVALALDLQFITVFLTFQLINSTALLPISISGLGVVETAGVIVYSLIGLSGGEALALILLDRMTYYIVDTLIGGPNLLATLRKT